MKALTRVTLALAAVALAHTVSAADALPAPTSAGIAAHRAAVAKKQALVAHAASAQAGAGVTAVQSTTGGPRIANPYRAYPPSCASYPLPDTPGGSDRQSATVPLYTRDGAGNPGTPENVTITIWRVACSSSGFESPYNFDGGANAMMLMRIDRSSNSQGRRSDDAASDLRPDDIRRRRIRLCPRRSGPEHGCLGASV